ncbi:MAG: FAD-binding oxidoreductase [Methanosarcinaceae archaeon]|nr:FAD-binding oxidoreductase [Methanosarcinaceae archaeon]
MGLITKLQEIVGIERATVSPMQLYCYSSDASQIRGTPDCVVRPQDTGQVSKILKFANEHDIPVTARGAGTGLAGGAVALEGGIVLDLSGMDRILDIDINNLQVAVEPGVVHSKLNEVLKAEGFFFPPDPGSSAMCTIGGLIANNGSGMRSVKYGTTRSYVLDLEVVMADGSVIHTGSKTLKSSAGYDLTRLMVGSEGTLGVITKAILKIHPLPKARTVVLASFETPELAGEAVVKTLSQGIIPSACEILDRTTVEVLNSYDPNIAIPDAGATILFELDGAKSSVLEEAEIVEAVCKPFASGIRVAADRNEMEEIWSARRLVGAAISRIDPNRTRVYVGEDIGVPIKEIPRMLKLVQSISEEFDLPIMTYGHVGDGNLHTGMCIDMLDNEQWERLNLAADKIHKTAIMLGGTVSAEHGIGSARSEYMRLERGDALDVMILIKRALDPKGILNPGKLGV